MLLHTALLRGLGMPRSEPADVQLPTAIVRIPLFSMAGADPDPSMSDEKLQEAEKEYLEQRRK